MTSARRRRVPREQQILLYPERRAGRLEAAAEECLLEQSVPTEAGPGGRIDVTLIARGVREQFSFSPHEVAIIGRGRSCRVRVPDDVEGVSRTHARLSWSNGWLVLEDLGSTNGTWIDDQRIKHVVLRPPAHHHIELGRPETYGGPGGSLSIRIVPVGERPVSAASRKVQQSTEPRPHSSKNKESSWRDLPPTSPSPQIPRDRTVFSQALKTIRSRPDGATLAEIRESFRELDLYHHDPAKLLRWQNANRGWGFRMNPQTGRVTIWAYDEESRVSASAALVETERREGSSIQFDHEQQQMQEQLERRRMEAEAAWEHEWRRLDEERQRLQQERRLFEEERQRARSWAEEDTDPTLSSLPVEEASPDWLEAIPDPDRNVFQHLAAHGHVNEEEATQILGGPRHFRRFSLRFEDHLVHCPFKVRVEIVGKVKSYVRDD